VSPRSVEASAPCRVDLVGAGLDVWPVYLAHPGAVTVCVGIDRRAWCRVETGIEGVEIESKDTLQKVSGRDLSEILGKGDQGLAAQLLRAFGVETGVRVVTHLRVPAASGLGGSSALAVAIAGAVAHAIGRKVGPDAIWPMTRDAEAQMTGLPTGLQDYQPALRGGALVLHLDPGEVRVERLAADPARIEESLLLVDAGPTRSAGMSTWDVLKGQVEGDTRVREALATIAQVARRVYAALVTGRFDDAVDLLAEEWEARKRLAPEVTTPQIEKIAAAARAAGGAARPCGAGGGGTVAVWAPPSPRGPGRREAVKASLEAAGFRAVPARVDLRGLDVE
jgi:D-glycero-alpha-D-manno-heptose-7-phosphate kinase